MSSCLDMRFFGVSHNTLLSPAIVGKTGNGSTATLEILSWKYTPESSDFFKTIAGKWKHNNEDDGRPKIIPHWGKQWQLLEDPLSYFEEGFGENLSHFKRIRKEAGVDPNNMFVNKGLDKIFKFIPIQGN